MKPSDLAMITRVMGPVVREFTAKAVSEAVAAVNEQHAERYAAFELRILELETRPPVDGPAGLAGQKGETGAGIASLMVSAEGRLVAHLTDGRSLDAGPVPKGEDGAQGMSIMGPQGEPGKDAPAPDMEAIVTRVLALVPQPERGEKGERGERGERGPDGVDGLNGKDGVPGLDGKDGAPGLDGKDGAPGLNGKDGSDGLHGKDGAAGLDGKDGAPGDRGFQGEKGLDGAPGDAGRDGRDGLPGASGKPGEKGLDGRDGVDGLGFDDIQVAHDGERSFDIKFVRGDRVKSCGTFTIPAQIDRGVYQAGKTYERGDGTTHDGGFWIAQTKTHEPPGEGSSAWRLAVRRGKQGREGKKGDPGADGRDLTQMDPQTGRKW